MSRKGTTQGQTLLDRYSHQFGVLIERTAAMSALETARRDAEAKEKEARHAADAATASNSAMQHEINRRVETQSRLAHMATHDSLTGLANRMLLTEQLERAVAGRRDGSSLALLYLDLDHFKDVNDTLGHAAGDNLLRTVSRRIEGCLRGDALVARMGGDEFALFVNDLDGPGASMLAQRIIAALADPIATAGHRVFVGASIGITICPDDGEDVGTLMSNGDIAMYRAKQEGRNCYQLFDKSLNDRVRRRATLEQALHEAVPMDQVQVAYQPQVELATGRIVGVEALLRWTHPRHGVVLPEEFVPIAERSGLINNLGGWILHESCRQIEAWNQAGMPRLRVAVNLATAQFRSSDVPRLVAEVLDATGLPADQLELEITETGVMHDMRDAAEVLRSLAAIGVSLAIDDFGTGYSSLSYLRQLPVDRIKIDRSFVNDVVDNEDAAAVAKAMVGLAHTLRLSVVAEGVETAAQEAFIRGTGAAYGQGYFYGRPQPPKACADLIARGGGYSDKTAHAA